MRPRSRQPHRPRRRPKLDRTHRGLQTPPRKPPRHRRSLALFPDWFRSVAPLPPGPGAAKARQIGLIESLQTRSPLWVRAQGVEPDKLWDELRSQNVKTWVHRRLKDAARLDPDVDLYHLPAFEHGRLEVQDLASQAVAHVAQPDPGERWWDACAGAGGKALHLAALMQGKGVVIASDLNDGRLKEAVRRARRSPFRNISTKLWDGKHVVGKSGKYDGVLVDAPMLRPRNLATEPRSSMDSRLRSRQPPLRPPDLRSSRWPPLA